MPEKKSLDFVRPELAGAHGAANLVFNEKIKQMKKLGRNVHHFAFGQSPFPLPACMKENLREFAGATEYLTTEGIPELREGIIALHKKYDNITLLNEGIVVGPGSKELIYLTMLTFNGVILVPSPAWTTYVPQIKLAGKSPVIVDTDEHRNWKITPESLQKTLDTLSNDVNKLLIFTNPGNPTGLCYTETELQELSEVCRNRGIIVLSDEIYARLSFSGKHHSFAKHYPDGTILSSGFSKCTSAGGWRLGYVHFPSKLLSLKSAVSGASSHTYSCAPTPMQYAVAKTLNNNMEDLDEYFKNCRRILKTVQEYCFRELESVGVTGCKSEAGYYCMPNFEVIRQPLANRGVTDGEEMSKLMLQEADIAIMSASRFLRPLNELTTRFCFVCFDGAAALDGLKNDPCFNNIKEGPLGDDFVIKYCDHLVEGIHKLRSWIIKLKNE